MVDGKTILVGSEQLLNGSAAGADLQRRSSERAAASVVHIGQRNGDESIARLGAIELADEIKPDSHDAIRALHQMRLRTVLLTGDNRATAEAIAKQVGIDDIRAEVKPDQKAAAIELQQQTRQLDAESAEALGQRRRDTRVAMVGDGINDAPALAQTDLGIAIGSGSDIAKETGDLVLVGGSLMGIATAIRLSRATMRTVRQNLFLAFIYNVLAIPFAAFGFASPLLAAGAMALSDVAVIGNALLLRRTNID